VIPAAAIGIEREPARSAEEVCSVCRHGPAPVCDRCRLRTAEQLAALPGLRDRLRVAMVPGSGGGERVSTAHGEAPMPARLSALSLVAGGSDDAHALFVPAMRVWTTIEVVIPLRPVITWHRELTYDANGRLVMALADDQTGVLPVRAWLKAWALEWRLTFGHSTGERTVATAATPIDVRQRITAAQLGIAAALSPAQRPDDPVADEWHARWPHDAAGWGPATRNHHAYLTHWLDHAVDLPHFPDFAVSLRALTGAVRAALGDIDDLEYVGRCPDEVTDKTTSVTTICGAAIWHDPYASVITCPRCHAETGNERRIWLARRILDAWPIDRRRRYPRGLISVLRAVPCSVCGTNLRVQWIDATERADRERFWRPGPVTCPNGCEVSM
jgi:hypothetical protein